MAHIQPKNETDRAGRGLITEPGVGYQFPARPIQTTSWPSVPELKISRPGSPNLLPNRIAFGVVWSIEMRNFCLLRKFPPEFVRASQIPPGFR
jgi:hypothetical protein